MSREHLDALRSLYGQFAKGDFSAYEAVPDEFELVLAPEMPDAGSYRGERARRWLAAWIDSFDDLRVDAVDFADAGDKVLVEMIQRGRPAGTEAVVELRNWAVSTMHDGVVVRWEMFMDRDEALAAAGLPGGRSP